MEILERKPGIAFSQAEILQPHHPPPAAQGQGQGLTEPPSHQATQPPRVESTARNSLHHTTKQNHHHRAGSSDSLIESNS